jgi:hypothetical protein
MAPDKPPAEDMKDPGASEEFHLPGKAGEKKSQPGQKQDSSCGSCGCG